MRKLLRVCRIVFVSMACSAWLLPVHVARATQPGPGAGGATAVGIVDVRLDAQGSVRGLLVDAVGQPLVARPVILQQAGGAVCSTQTGTSGGFVLHGVSGGVHRLVVGDRVVVCRVWTSAAAPPAAMEQLTLVAGQPVVRGQQPFGAVFTNPLFIGLLIAAAIAIPVAVHNAQDDRPPGS